MAGTPLGNLSFSRFFGPCLPDTAFVLPDMGVLVAWLAVYPLLVYIIIDAWNKQDYPVRDLLVLSLLLGLLWVAAIGKRPVVAAALLAVSIVLTGVAYSLVRNYQDDHPSSTVVSRFVIPTYLVWLGYTLIVTFWAYQKCPSTSGWGSGSAASSFSSLLSPSSSQAQLDRELASPSGY